MTIIDPEMYAFCLAWHRRERKSQMSDDMRTPGNVRALAVGNAVYLEHVGGCGDIASWAEANAEHAQFVADQINGVLNGLRASLADTAQKAGEYAHWARQQMDARDAEIARLQRQVEGHCERIAAASEVIARNAERSPTARLEAWRLVFPDERSYELLPYKVTLAGAFGHFGATAFRCPSERNDYGGRLDPAHVAVAGTDEQPATIDQCIHAALDLWERLYGEGGGA